MSQGTDPVPVGIDAAAVSAWLDANIAGAAGPYRFELISGGRSNLTYRVTDQAGNHYALRRPPLGHVLATAHDMAREHRIIKALANSPVPVAPALGLCEDPTVNEAPFYVMGFVEGTIVRDLDAAEGVPVAVRQAASTSLVETMAALHAVDVDTVGLGDLGKRDGYVERQLKRWMTQVGQSLVAEEPIFAEVHAELAARAPKNRQSGAIAHGDFRLENTVLAPDGTGTICAVLDWELCTLGDPLADLGLLMVYWPGPGPTDPITPKSPTVLEGFASHADMIAGYGRASGRDLSDFPYYFAFSDWRLACIGAGVYTRYSVGAMGSAEDVDLDEMRTTVLLRAGRAQQTLREHR